MTSPVAMASFPTSQDDPLRPLMAQAQIPSYRALSQRSGVSRSTLTQIRRGHLGRLRLETLERLSHALGLSVTDLITALAPSKADHGPTADPPTIATVATLRREYEQLQQQVIHQESAVRQRVQQEALAMVESWLLMWPNAVEAAQQKPDLLASKIIPLLRPLQGLLQTWAVQPIGAVGEIVPYDPQIHHSLGGAPSVGQSVQVRQVGYWHGDRLLHRAKVVPVGVA